MCRSAVVEGLRHGAAVSLLLQIVVTDFGCGVEGFFDVTVFKRMEAFVVVVSPDACIKVCLKLQTNAKLVCCLLAAAGALLDRKSVV